MKLGIVGLPNVGKSTLFNALTKSGVHVANYPFCTIDPNVGMVQVPDERIDFLTDLYKPQKSIPATIEFVDIAGLVRGASKGEGLGNMFLGNIRNVDAIIHVVRCFDDDNITHVEESTDPQRDIEIIEIELILSDMSWIERRIDKVSKMVKSGDPNAADELKLLNKIMEAFEKGIPARALSYDDSELSYLKNIYLLTLKPVLYVANINEEDINSTDNKYLSVVEKIASCQNSQVISLSLKLEEEIALLEPEERDEFLKDLGINKSGLSRVISSGYKLLNLISFFTVGEDEVRAWTITNGTKAPQAVGKIHSDMERGFIRAEILAYDDLVKCSTYNKAREKGLVRSEGKNYIMKDGDITHILFNV